MNRFTIDKIKKGDQVVIASAADQEQKQQEGDGGTKRQGGGEEAVPRAAQFATVTQMKTFGLPGEVLEVDSTTQLVHVETYLTADGLLVRHWYPLSWLQRPIASKDQSSKTVNTATDKVHREVLNTDFALSRLHCRDAYLHLLNFAKGQDVGQNSSRLLQRSTSAEITMFTSSVLLLQVN